MSAPVRPIHILSDAACESLRERAQAALDAWTREWVIGCASDEQPLPRLRVSAALEGVGPKVYQCYDLVRAEEGSVWFRSSIADRSRCGEAVVGAALMSGSDYADEWITAIAARAWVARNHALCSALLGAMISEGPDESLPASLFAFGSGAVHLSCDALGLHATADSGVWRLKRSVEVTPAQRLAVVTPVDRAMHQASARLDVMLGSVEVDLPKLLDLRRGDVLRLPQRLHEGIQVLCEGKPLAHALLGDLQGRKSVQVLTNDQ